MPRGFTLGSAYVAEGYENIEASTPPCERQFVSRMVTAQFDSIGYNHVLMKLKREVLDDLWLLMQKRTDTTFFTVYLIVFMMLHEVSVACQDRRRRAMEQGLKVRDGFVGCVFTMISYHIMGVMATDFIDVWQ